MQGYQHVVIRLGPQCEQAWESRQGCMLSAITGQAPASCSPAWLGTCAAKLGNATVCFVGVLPKRPGVSFWAQPVRVLAAPHQVMPVVRVLWLQLDYALAEGSACVTAVYPSLRRWAFSPSCSRFRTQFCQKGAACDRPLCFFAHDADELR